MSTAKTTSRSKNKPGAKRTSKSVSTLGVSVIGCGYWGPNLIRNFEACPNTFVTAVCDRDSSQLARAKELAPEAKLVKDYGQVLRDPRVEAVAIATPVHTHFDLASAALRAGKHVLVEKPLTASVHEAESLVELAKKRNLTLMVDHTFIFSPPIRKIGELIRSGALGELLFIDSVRINLGLFQSDVNVLWDLAPHDLSIVDYFVGQLPRSLSAVGASHTDSELHDIGYLNLDFGKSLIATFHVNWLSPVKIRHVIIGGSKKSVVFNDLDPSEPVKIYDRGIERLESQAERQRALVSYRMGDTHSPHLPREEPLRAMVEHFAECVREKKTPITDGQAGLRVVRILEAAQRSIEAQGGRITL